MIPDPGSSAGSETDVTTTLWRIIAIWIMAADGGAPAPGLRWYGRRRLPSGIAKRQFTPSGVGPDGSREPGSTGDSGVDHSDIDLAHRHHRLHRPLGRGRIGVLERCHQRPWGDLPREPPPVLAPATVALGTTVADDRVPVVIRFGLVVVNTWKLTDSFGVNSGPPLAPRTPGWDRELDRELVALATTG